MSKTEVTACSGGECVEVEAIGGDWFRVRSTANARVNIAVTGPELRAFLRQVKIGQFDEIAGLAPDTTVAELLNERDALLARVDELEQAAGLRADVRVVA